VSEEGVVDKPQEDKIENLKFRVNSAIRMKVGRYMGDPEMKEGGNKVPGKKFGMDCEGMSDGEAKKEHIGRKDEEKSDHGWEAVGGFFQEVEKLRISPRSRN
jgi:hypothetical protein